MALDDADKLNLENLQHSDPYIEKIAFSAKHVALYSFKVPDQQWSKANIEGPCFIYQRTAKPFYGFVIINQLDTSNFIEVISDEHDFQVSDSFVLYKNSSGTIYGIWFYDGIDGERFNNIVTQYVLMARQDIDPHVKNHTIVRQASGDNVNIIDMLSKAQSSTQTSQGEPSRMGLNAHQPHMVKPQAIKLLTQISQTDNKPVSAGQPISITDLFQQAAVSSTIPNLGDGYNFIPESAAFKRIPHEKITPLSELEGKGQRKELLTPASLSAAVQSDKSNTGLPANNTSSRPNTPPKVTLMPVKATIELMSPMAFSGYKHGPTSPTQTNPPVIISVKPTAKGSINRSLARSFSQSDPVPLEPDTPVAALTKEQLKQALVHMLNTDDNFISSIHSAYVESLNATFQRP